MHFKQKLMHYDSVVQQVPLGVLGLSFPSSLRLDCSLQLSISVFVVSLASAGTTWFPIFTGSLYVLPSPPLGVSAFCEVPKGTRNCDKLEAALQQMLPGWNRGEKFRQKTRG